MKICINNRKIGKGEPVFIIAEAGVNHNGDISIAKRLIDIAKESGADAVKFQTFIAEDITSISSPKADYQKQTTDRDESQLEMLKKFELSFAEFREIKRYCDAVGIIFLSTPFDQKSVDFLDELGIPAFKIPSGEITNFPLLKQIRQKKKPIILSTGMSTLEEIGNAVDLLKINGANDIVLLHCTTAYPAHPDSVNLRAMKTMHQKFNLPVGYSDHTNGITISIAAVALGATIIEKHFTLDKNLPGPDHKASLEPNELMMMVQAIRDVEMAFGNGIKNPAPCEIENEKSIRRSIVANKDIPKNAIIDQDSIIAKRPGTGISPINFSLIIGSRTKKEIKKDTILTWEDIILKPVNGEK